MFLVMKSFLFSGRSGCCMVLFSQCSVVLVVQESVQSLCTLTLMGLPPPPGHFLTPSLVSSMSPLGPQTLPSFLTSQTLGSTLITTLYQSLALLCTPVAPTRGPTVCFDLLWACLVAQSCLTVCDRVDCGLPGSSVHGVLQVRILQWVAMPYSRGSSQPRNQTQVSHVAGRFFPI